MSDTFGTLEFSQKFSNEEATRNFLRRAVGLMRLYAAIVARSL